ncbi:hypothetical protein OSTOST_07305 [Ostertagia ostertagi]
MARTAVYKTPHSQQSRSQSLFLLQRKRACQVFWHFLAFYVLVPLFTAELALKWPPSGAYLEEAGSSPIFVDDLSSSSSYYGDVEVNFHPNYLPMIPKHVLYLHEI